tara:strand:+ start:399 stop:671 length:273 start_codon:yes stop_codon:yes gene_type:complete
MTTKITFTESEHPAALHQQDINACVHHIRDAVVDYLESDILTAGEFVSAIKTALGDSLNHHQTRANLLKDAEQLLSNNVSSPFRLDELQE